MNTTVLFRLRAASGAPMPTISITARLTEHDVDDGELVAQQAISAVTDAAGEATLSLWPNTRGQRGTKYLVEWADATGRRLDSYTITVPESTAALSPTALLGADLKARLENCATVQTTGDQLAALM